MCTVRLYTSYLLHCMYMYVSGWIMVRLKFPRPQAFVACHISLGRRVYEANRNILVHMPFSQLHTNGTFLGLSSVSDSVNMFLCAEGGPSV